MKKQFQKKINLAIIDNVAGQDRHRIQEIKRNQNWEKSGYSRVRYSWITVSIDYGIYQSIHPLTFPSASFTTLYIPLFIVSRPSLTWNWLSISTVILQDTVPAFGLPQLSTVFSTFRSHSGPPSQNTTVLYLFVSIDIVLLIANGRQPTVFTQLSIDYLTVSPPIINKLPYTFLDRNATTVSIEICCEEGDWKEEFLAFF